MASPIWLFTGPELGERNSAIETVKNNIRTKMGGLDIHIMYAYESNIFEVMNTLQSTSLFEAATLVILRNCESIKKKNEIEALVSWANTPSTNSFLILVSDEISIDKKIEKCVPPSQKKIFWEMFENKKHDWVRNFFSKEGLRIEKDAISTILELVENNTEALKNECMNISIFFEKGHCISENDINNLLAHNKEETAFSLFDAMTFNNLELSIGILQKLMLSKTSSPVQLIAGLKYCFRRLLDFHDVSIQTGRLPDDMVLKKFGFTSKKAITQYRRASNLWNYSLTLQIISVLTEVDLEIRSLGTNMSRTIMETVLYNILNLTIEFPEYDCY